MGFGLMSVVVAPSASAITTTVTGTVSPVRVTNYSATAFTSDAVQFAKISWTTTNTLATTDTAVLTLTVAPTATARVKLAANA